MKSSFMKKLLATALVAIMAVSMLAGCGKSSGKVVRVMRACFNLGNIDEAQEKKVVDAINAYLKDKGRDYTITLADIPSGEYTEKANLAIANKEIDLLWTASWEDVIGTNQLFTNQAAYDISDLVVGTDLYKSMAVGQWEAGKYDGKIFYVPVYKDNVEGYDLMVRKALVDKYNFDLSSVKKLADIEPMLKVIKEEEGLKYPLLTQKTAMFFRYYINDFDFFTQKSLVAVDRTSNSVVNVIATPQYAEFCKLMAKWAELGYVSEDDVTKTTTDTTTQTQDWGFSWWTDIPVNDEANSRYKQDVVMTPITDRWAHSTSALGSCYAIMKSCDEATAKNAIDFLGLLYTDSKLADIYTFGIEGEDFTYDANHQVSQKADAKYNHSMWESASATVVTPLDNEPANKASLYDAFNGGAKTSCAAGFRYDKTPVEAEYTACESIWEEYGFVLENGGYKEAEVDAKIAEYIDKLNAAGYQKVLDEFTKQYNAWK
ncbi:MAG: ABC transporter substrate-binding protein [Lachnospiraceae bacterium]|nr:ABC transporter substrate-binding protein [Lachnospiraceae bacterium]